MSAIPRLRSERFAEDGNLCSFGLGDFLVPAIEAVLPIAAGPAGIIADVGIGAGAGAGLAALTGGKPGLGALTGGITGGAIGAFGGPLGDVLGGPIAGDIAAGAAGGLVGSAITGQSPLSGALTGAAAGGFAGLTSGGPGGGGEAPAHALAAVPGQGAAGGGASAAATAAPSAAAVPSQLDFTQPAPGGGAVADLSDGVPAGVSGAPIAGAAAGGGSTMVDGNPFLVPGGGLTDLAAQNPNPILGPVGAATGVGGTAMVPGGAGTAIPGIGGMINQLTSNPAALVGLGGLTLAGMRESRPLPEQQALSQLAAKQLGMANNMTSYLNTGTLPPGMQAAVDAASASAKAEARGRFQNLGLTGSTMEGEALQNIDRAVAAQTAAIAENLFKQGVDLSGMAANEFHTLLQETLAQDTAFQAALGNFTRGLAGGTGVAGQAVQTTATA